MREYFESLCIFCKQFNGVKNPQKNKYPKHIEIVGIAATVDFFVGKNEKLAQNLYYK